MILNKETQVQNSMGNTVSCVNKKKKSISRYIHIDTEILKFLEKKQEFFYSV